MEKKKRKSIYECFFKRFFDIICSLLALIILSPVFLIVWICSKISIGGKAIFSQYRPGKNGKIFKFYKFRSMTNKTDENGNLLPDAQRITKFGKIIRKLSVDELPQLWNILKGDMSFVGPRPRLVKDFVFYPKEVLESYTARPGLTGPAQVYDRNSELSWQSVFERDAQYCKNITFWNDIKLLFGTVKAIFKGGAQSGAGSSVENEEQNKREYYYPDQLLKDNEITKEQYDMGLEIAKQKTSKKGENQVVFEERLHNSKD